MNAIRNTLRDDRGSILVVTLLILFAIGVMGATMATMSSMDLRISSNQRLDTQAFDVAEAGLNEAVHRLMLPDPTVATVGGWTGNVAIADKEPYDPKWEVRLYLTGPGQVSSGKGSIVNTGTIQDPNGDYLSYSQSGGTDDVLTIKHKWVDRDGDGNRDANEVVRYQPEMIPPENFISGFPVEVVTVTGRRGAARRTIESEVTRRTLLARTLGAIYLNTALDIQGSPDLCGHNHSINIPSETEPNACFAYHLGSGSLPAVTTTGDAVDVGSNSADLFGDPTPTDTSSINPWYTFAEVLGVTEEEAKQILANAENTSVVDPLNGVTYLNGPDFKINSSLDGEGLLYCSGNLTINGDLEYRGLIYVEGNVKVVGGCWVLGTIICKGTADYEFSAGNGAVLYSKDAIQQYVGRYMPAIILSWREL